MAKNNTFDDWEDLPLDDDWEDIPLEQSMVNEETPSMLESSLRGAAQGLTLDFADEIVGGAEAAYNVAAGNDPIQDLLKNYVKYRDESREAFTAAQEENPGAYLAGEIGGGIAPALLSGGASAIGSAGTIGVKAAAKQAAKAGALVGATSAAGQTEDISDIPQTATDIVAGAALGGVVGGAVPPIAKVGKVAAEFPVVKETIKAFKYGKQGVPIIGEEATEAALKGSRATADTIEEMVTTQRKEGSQTIGDALAKADAELGPINIEELLKSYQNLTKTIDPVTDAGIALKKDLSRELSRYAGKPEMLPSELKKVTRRLGEIMDSADEGAKKTEAYSAITSIKKDLTKELDDALEDAGGELAQMYSQGTKEYQASQEIRDLLRQIGGNEKQSTDLAAFMRRDVDPFKTSGLTKTDILSRVQDNLSVKDPQKAKRVIDEIKDVSEKYELTRLTDKFGFDANTLKNIGVRTGAAAGKITEAVVPAPFKRVGESIKKRQLAPITSSFSQTGSNEFIPTSSEYLQEILEDMDEKYKDTLGKQIEKALSAEGREREALLFGLKQQPGFRELMKKYENNGNKTNME